jgi:hypothetical protein
MSPQTSSSTPQLRHPNEMEIDPASAQESQPEPVVSQIAETTVIVASIAAVWTPSTAAAIGSEARAGPDAQAERVRQFLLQSGNTIVGIAREVGVSGSRIYRVMVANN